MSNSYSTIDKRRNLPFGKLKVLLAEDNEVNQLLARGILQYWGLESKLAVTGFEVMELLLAEDFDLVLMDIQMPGKSGIEASTEIRSLTEPKKKNIPIIALTANALIGEEKKYFAAGINDFLTKPFREGDLYEVIERVLLNDRDIKTNNVYQIQGNLMEPEKEKAEELYNLKQLEEIAGGNMAFLTSLAKIYLDTIPTNSADMVKATQSGDWETASKLAHKLKSTIDSLNMYSVKSEIRTIEIDGKNKSNTDQLKSLALHVDIIINKVATQLKQDFSL